MVHHTSINIRTSMVNEYDHFTIHGYEDLFMQVLEDQGQGCVIQGIKEDGNVSFMARLTYDKTPE